MSRKSKSVLPKRRKSCLACGGSGRSKDEDYHTCGIKPGVMVFDSCRCDCVPVKCPGCGGSGNRERTNHRIVREVMEG